MQKSKKLFFILAFVMVVSVISITVLAEAKSTPTRTTTLKVAGLTEVTDMLASEGWKWAPDADGGTLTLRNCYIRASESIVLYLGGKNVNIVLEGENTLETTSTNYGSMIYSDGIGGVENLTISAGSAGGKLNILRHDTSITTMNPYGFGGENITIQSGDIYANTDFCIIASNFTMLDGSLTVENENSTDSMGIYSLDGNINISGGNLDINAGYIGIVIIEDADVSVSLTGGDVKIRSGLAGIYAKNITVDTDGALDLQGKTTALYCSTVGGTLQILKAGSLTLAGGKPYIPGATGGGKTVIIAAANYTKVDEAVAKIPADLGGYTDATVKALNEAKDAVVRGKDVTEQTVVNGYAAAVEAAVAALKYKDADYSRVDRAIAKIPSNLGVYTDQSAKAVIDAKNAVVRGKNITEQAFVDGYATAIEEAINQLVKKPAQSLNDPSSGIRLEYEDGTLIDGNIELSILPQSQADMERFKDKVTKAAPGHVLGGLYEMKLLKSGVPIQPSGRMRIRIPLTETTKYMTEQKIIYIDNHGAVTLVPSTIENGMIVYVIDHFSYYGVIGKLGSKHIPKTGDHTPILLLALLMVASAGVIAVVSRKKRMTH